MAGPDRVGPQRAGIGLGSQVIATFALAYTVLAVVNTTVIAFARRRREFARLRVIGAKRPQILRMVLWESLATAAAGLTFGAIVVTAATAGLWLVLLGVGLRPAVTLPWSQLAGMAAAALVLVIVAALTPTAALLAGRPSRDLTNAA